MHEFEVFSFELAASASAGLSHSTKLAS